MKNYLALALLLLTTPFAQAAVIDFEDNNTTNWYQQTIQSQDYNFYKLGGWMGVNHYASWLPSAAFNGTQDLDMGYGLFIMGHNEGKKFDFSALDAGLSWYNYDSFDDLIITGYQLNGDSISASLTLSHSYQNFQLDGFSNLDFVTFSGQAISTGYVAVDNLQVEAVSVPEPGMIPLLSFGLAGLLFARRKRTCT